MFTITSFARSNFFALATAITVALISSFFIAVPFALAGVGVGVTPSFPSPVTVGDNNVAVTLTVTNNSDGGDGNPLTLNNIKLVPSCGTIAGVSCSTPDLGVFSVDPSGTGSGACAANTFTIAQTDGVTGEVTFTPDVPITLTPGQTCVINFAVDVVGAPDTDATGAAGLQTLQLGNVTGTDQLQQPGSGFGSDTTTVNKVSPTIGTTPSAGGPIGTILNDTATLSGGSSPTGNVTFKLFAPGDATCSAAAVYTEVDASAPYTTSPGYTSLVAGTYRWTADYAGDANNNAASSGCQEEQVTITKASPTISTIPSAGGPIGTVLNDTATLTGGASPTGDVVFTLYAPSDATCVAAPVYTDTDTASPYATTGGYVSLVAGVYHWKAAYAGDANNNAVTSPCSDEAVTITKVSPTIQTTPSAGGPIGTVLNDTATLSGGSSPTGNVTFKLFPPSDAACSGVPVYEQTDGTTPYATSPGYTSLVAGTYRWTADYAGDANNNPASSGCELEQVVIGKASPTIQTTPSAGGPIGTILNDTATLSGGSSPTGNVTFKLFPPSDATCSAAAVYTEVDASAPYTTSPGYTSLVAGTYRWTADYAGDANNNAVSSGCQEEQVVIGKFTPSISTVLSTTTTSTSTPVHDTATLSGASADAGGTATYSVFTNSACSAGMMSAGVKNVVNGVVPNSDPLVFATPGTYYWQVEYSGDAKNESATSPCRSEILVVVAPPPTGCEVDWKPVGSGWMDFAPVVFLNKGGRLLDPNNPCPFKYPLDYSPGPVKPRSR